MTLRVLDVAPRDVAAEALGLLLDAPVPPALAELTVRDGDGGALTLHVCGSRPLGVHPDTPLDAQPGAAPDAPPDALPDDGAEERPAPPSPADVTRHAALLLADLLAARSRPLRPYLEATFTEMARAAASD